MANVSFDFSAGAVFRKGEDSFRKYTYRDIGTSNIREYKEQKTKENKIDDVDSSNYDQAAIKQSLKNLFMFRQGEQILQPEFGNQLYRYLYEPFMSFTTDKIIRTIKQMIERWEPRIQIVDIPVEVDEQHQCYYLQLIFLIPTLQKESSVYLSLNKTQVEVR